MKKFFLATICGLLVSTFVFAVPKYWVGPANGNWNDPANWSFSSGGSGGAGVPGISDSVVFANSTMVNVNTSSTVAALTVRTAATAVLYTSQATVLTILSNLLVQPSATLRDSTSAAVSFNTVLSGASSARGSILGRWEFIGGVPLAGTAGAYFTSEPGAIVTVGNNTTQLSSGIVFNSNSGSIVSTASSLVFTHAANFVLGYNTDPMIPAATWAGQEIGGGSPTDPDLAASVITVDGNAGNIRHLLPGSHYGSFTATLNNQQADVNLNFTNGTWFEGNVYIAASNGKSVTLLAKNAPVNSVRISYTTTTESGNFTLAGANTRVALSTVSPGDPAVAYSLSIGGNYNQTGGNFSLQDNNSTGGSAVLAVKTNINQTAGTFLTNSTELNKRFAVEMYGPVYFARPGGYRNQGQSIRLSSGTIDNPQHNVVLRVSQGFINSYLDTKLTGDLGVVLATPVSVGKLEMIRGTLTSSTAALLTVNNPDPSSISQGTDSSYIIGPFQFSTASSSAYLIPTGSEPTYNGGFYKMSYTTFHKDTMTLSPSSATPSVYRAQYFSKTYSDSINLASPLLAIAKNKYWDITKISGADASVKLTLNGVVAGSSADNSLVVARYDGGQWVAVNGSVLTPGNAPSGFATSKSLSSFGPLTFGIVNGTPSSGPAKVTNLQAINIASTFAYLDWTPSSGGSGALVYNVIVSAGGNSKTYTSTNSNITINNLLPNTSYNVNVYARDANGNQSPASDALSVLTATTATGLKYRYYEGDWNSLPDFDAIKPLKTGSATNVDLAIKNRGDYFGVVWEGMIKIPTPGNYTFEILSDDGSKFYFNSLYSPTAVATVDNDGLHYALASGTVNNVTAGLHPFALSFFEKWGGETMEIYWTGPGISRQRIPESAFVETQQPSLGNLEFHYYEGDWNTVPAFDAIPETSSGKSANIDLSVRRSGVDDYFGFVWNGYLKLDAPGDYTFETISDDGSKFYFNTHYAGTLVPTVNNDGLHGEISASSVVHVPSAGVYPVSIAYFEKWGGESMKVYYSGPNLSRQEIPSSAFVARPADNVNPSLPTSPQIVSSTETSVKLKWNASTDDQQVAGYGIYVNGVYTYTTTATEFTINELTPQKQYAFNIIAIDQAKNQSGLSETVPFISSGVANAGLKYRYYEGDWNSLPDFNALTPVKKGIVPSIDLSMKNVNDYFGVIYEGYLTVPAGGQYTFEMPSDDGSRFYFNQTYSSSAVPTLDNDGLHGDGTIPSVTINIPAAGTYPIAVTYFEKWGGESLRLYWTGPTRAREEIPATFFTHDPDIALATTGTGSRALSNAQADVLAGSLSRVYPNPFVDKVMVEFSNTIANSQAAVDMYDIHGKRVYSQRFSNLQIGRSLLNVNVSGMKLPSGVYMMKLSVNGIPSKVMQLVKGDK